MKNATTTAPLHPLLTERWSPRAFDNRHELSKEQLTTLLEAARWAPSASNTQPWRFAVAERGTEAHTKVLEALAPGNQVWAHAASALIVAAAETTTPDGTERPWAVYDTGQAVAHLSVQAQHDGIAVHQLGGFDRARVTELLGQPGLTPQVVLAVGRRDEFGVLAEPFAEREAAPRDRVPVENLLVSIAA
ncbi:nitroreductase family protein [Actinoplanes couchii]|uniref:Nitroreductase n=1 Tax=Actinoplanes couchii TaxID=403638 RepID=A0ABQ3XE10_9ACTN|nr:nitroreductase family protein [Actinoplanes couchii]MDR6317146.1 nitroreductase [Actinoplanes couchii]GID56640.1 nitroreductase [Actinoplanes couchii]